MILIKYKYGLNEIINKHENDLNNKHLWEKKEKKEKKHRNDLFCKVFICSKLVLYLFFVLAKCDWRLTKKKKKNSMKKIFPPYSYLIFLIGILFILCPKKEV